MAYIGTSPSNGVRRRFVYEATASQTSFSGSDENGVTLTYVDSLYLDVFQNGIKLKAGDDYTATTGTTVVLVQGASANDVVEMVAFDVFSVGDTVSASDGGSFAGNVAMAGTLGVTGDTTVGGTLQVGVDGTTAGVIRFMDSGSVTEEATISSDANGGLIFGGNSGPGELIFKTNSGTEHMRINAIGAVTKPLQPAFSAYLSGTQSNIAVGSDVTISFAAERFDQNADFNTSNYTFVAPVTGKYLLSVSVQLSNSLDSAANYYQAKLVTSNKTYEDVLDPDFGQDNLYFPLEFSVLADMDADDTAIVKVKQTAGSQQTNVDSQSHFTGFLAC